MAKSLRKAMDRLGARTKEYESSQAEAVRRNPKMGNSYRKPGSLKKGS